MRRDLRAEGLLVFTTLIWGGTFAVIKSALQDISPLLLVGIRFILSALLAYPVLVPRRVENRQLSDGTGTEPASSRSGRFHLFTPAVWKWGALIAVGMLAGYAGQTIGLRYTTVARSGFITFSFALWVPFLQLLLLRQRPALGNLLGLFVVLWGLSLITDPSNADFSAADLNPLRIIHVAGRLLRGGLNIGDLYTLGGAVGYAFYVVLLDRATRECHPGAVTVVQMLFCGLYAMILVPVFETPFLLTSWRLAGALLYLVVVGSVLALGLMNWFQRRLTPLRAVLIYALEPVFAAAVGWIVFRDGMSAREMAGAVFILSGILVSDLWIFLFPAGRVRNRTVRKT